MSLAHVPPIHAAPVGAGTLRFFASPLDGPRLPWFAVSDLFACLALPRGARRVLYASTKRRWADDVRLVWTETGETMIAPHWMARVLLECFAEVDASASSLEPAYAMAAGDAMKGLTNDMSALEGVAYSLAAFRNENGLKGEVRIVKGTVQVIAPKEESA